MLRNKRFIIFIMILLGICCYSTNAYAIVSCLVGNGPAPNKCPEIEDTYLVNVTYFDKNKLMRTVSLDEWLNDATVKDDDEAEAKFFYKESDKAGTTLVVHARVKRVRSLDLLQKDSYLETGFCCGVNHSNYVGVELTEKEKIDCDETPESSECKLNRYDCLTFQGTRLYIEILKPAYTIIRVVVPILVIVFAAKDLVGAVVSQKAEDMQKAQKSLITRIIIGIVIMILPTLVNALMNLSTFSQGTCGIG